METVLSRIPAWLPVYWVDVTLVRLVISIFVIYFFGRTIPIKKPSARTAGIVIMSALLTIWVVLAIYLGRLNFFRIDQDTPLPPPIAAGALIPIIIGYVAYRYWATFRQIILNVPQHWIIGLQAYRMTGGIFGLHHGGHFEVRSIVCLARSNSI